jgi:hypothetical protein
MGCVSSQPLPRADWKNKCAQGTTLDFEGVDAQDVLELSQNLAAGINPTVTALKLDSGTFDQVRFRVDLFD